MWLVSINIFIVWQEARIRPEKAPTSSVVFSIIKQVVFFVMMVCFTMMIIVMIAVMIAVMIVVMMIALNCSREIEVSEFNRLFRRIDILFGVIQMNLSIIKLCTYMSTTELSSVLQEQASFCESRQHFFFFQVNFCFFKSTNNQKNSSKIQKFRRDNIANQKHTIWEN